MKVGDEAYSQDGGYNSSVSQIVTITEITPRMVKTSDGKRYTHSLEEYGSTGYMRTLLVVLDSDEKRNLYKKRRLEQYIQNTRARIKQIVDEVGDEPALTEAYTILKRAVEEKR